MANFIKNILNGLNLDEEEDLEDDGYDWDEQPAKKSRRQSAENDDDIEEELPKRKTFGKKREEDSPEEEDVPEQKNVRQSKKNNNGKVVHMKPIQGGAGKMELRVMRPEIYDDSREICDTLSAGMPVVLNLEGLNGDLAQKILDFVSGAVYAMKGNLQKVASYIFVITPNNIDISGNFEDMLDGSVDLSGNSKYVYKD